MYQFARDEWTLESTERAGQRFAKFSDEKLLATMPAARYMVSPELTGVMGRVWHM